MFYKINKEKVLFADECFQINGACFFIQKQIGRFGKEKQFSDALEQRFVELKIPYKRELVAGESGNRADFILFDKIILELKAKPFLSPEDFSQVKRYLQILDLDLGLLVNFWARSALPHRILKNNNS